MQLYSTVLSVLTHTYSVKINPQTHKEKQNKCHVYTSRPVGSQRRGDMGSPYPYSQRNVLYQIETFPTETLTRSKVTTGTIFLTENVGNG
jgi:hypothetical protein